MGVKVNHTIGIDLSKQETQVSCELMPHRSELFVGGKMHPNVLKQIYDLIIHLNVELFNADLHSNRWFKSQLLKNGICLCLFLHSPSFSKNAEFRRT